MVAAATVSTGRCVNALHPALYGSRVSPQAKLFQPVKGFPFSLPAAETQRAGEGEGHFGGRGGGKVEAVLSHRRTDPLLGLCGELVRK